MIEESYGRERVEVDCKVGKFEDCGMRGGGGEWVVWWVGLVVV